METINRNKNIKVVQHNLNKDRVASHQLREWCRAQRVDFALIQEPLVQNGRIYAFENCRQVHLGKKSSAAIIVLTDRFQVISLGTYNSNHAIVIRATYGKGPLDFIVLVSA